MIDMLKRPLLVMTALAVNITLMESCKKNFDNKQLAPNDLSTGSPFAASAVMVAPAGQSARFNNLSSVAVDVSGTLYIADTKNHAVRKVTPAGVVTTIGGTGTAGFSNGPAATAQFRLPGGIAVDRSKNVYVADTYNHVIRMITPAGVVSTFAGTGVAGFADGGLTTAAFSFPIDLAIDGNGNIYVSDQGNRRVRKITRAGVVSTFAGTGEFNHTDGPGATATFGLLAGLTCDAPGNVYVTDSNHKIRKITRAGVVSSYAGNGDPGGADGQADGASFNLPSDVILDASGNLYVADAFYGRVRKITPDRIVSTLAGLPGLPLAGFADGPGRGARFGMPTGIAIDPFNNTLYVTDRYNNRVRTVDVVTGLTNTFAGDGVEGFVDGQGVIIRFSAPAGINLDAAGNLYVADAGNNRIRKITLAGVVSLLAGGSEGTADGIGALAQFRSPYDVAVDAAGNVFVADRFNSRIRKITPAGIVSTIMGTAGTGFAHGSAAVAKFYNPAGIDLDNSGNIYVAEAGNHIIRQITLDQFGYTAILGAGTAPSIFPNGQTVPNPGFADGFGAKFDHPSDVAVNRFSGQLFIADQFNNLIRAAMSRHVSTPAGLPFHPGYADGIGGAVRMSIPSSVACDSAGNVYFTDSGNDRIRKLTRTTGEVSTLAGSARGFADGTGSAALFSFPYGIAVNAAGTVVYISDMGNHSIRKLNTVTRVVTTIAGFGTAGL